MLPFSLVVVAFFLRWYVYDLQHFLDDMRYDFIPTNLIDMLFICAPWKAPIDVTILWAIPLMTWTSVFLLAFETYRIFVRQQELVC